MGRAHGSEGRANSSPIQTPDVFISVRCASPGRRSIAAAASLKITKPPLSRPGDLVRQPLACLTCACSAGGGVRARYKMSAAAEPEEPPADAPMSDSEEEVRALQQRPACIGAGVPCRLEARGGRAGCAAAFAALTFPRCLLRRLPPASVRPPVPAGCLRHRGRPHDASRTWISPGSTCVRRFPQGSIPQD